MSPFLGRRGPSRKLNARSLHPSLLFPQPVALCAASLMRHVTQETQPQASASVLLSCRASSILRDPQSGTSKGLGTKVVPERKTTAPTSQDELTRTKSPVRDQDKKETDLRQEPTA
ncbi:hypothetical protein TGDOM2_364240 [Toxoplasma gondii GAB2-2007-GAL-DOM2]|uniref:Uncharacterized protein n=2 Tax=Toxoplasma gondii TaxID=5811 RepID=A0A086LBV4_TOXGO|nr:hypothetical protein TGDOM2_364240 [Toxoplasma gondii GAB2-2007-GAL-DOM2]KFG54122.1 hypothetical protein TGFOU_364240 [Toxoplasma gondii FOU]